MENTNELQTTCVAAAMRANQPHAGQKPPRCFSEIYRIHVHVKGDLRRASDRQGGSVRNRSKEETFQIG